MIAHTNGYTVAQMAALFHVSSVTIERMTKKGLFTMYREPHKSQLWKKYPKKEAYESLIKFDPCVDLQERIAQADALRTRTIAERLV